MGEAAPLPGYSPDTLERCHAALHSCERVEATQSTSALSLPPAARFALETALLDWRGHHEDKAASELLGAPASPSPLPLCALLPNEANLDTLIEQAQGLARIFSTLKMKVGRDLPRELEAVRLLRRELPSQLQLRLDANRSLGTESARRWLPRFASHDIELIEEPCSEPELLELGVPLARDESLQDAPDDARPWLEGWAALVLKPTTLGGLERCLSLARQARDVGLEVTVSHTFEGPVAWAACAALALAVGSRKLASGLAPHAGLALLPEVQSIADSPDGSLRPIRGAGLGVVLP